MRRLRRQRTFRRMYLRTRWAFLCEDKAVDKEGALLSGPAAEGLGVGPEPLKHHVETGTRMVFDSCGVPAAEAPETGTEACEAPEKYCGIEEKHQECLTGSINKLERKLESARAGVLFGTTAVASVASTPPCEVIENYCDIEEAGCSTAQKEHAHIVRTIEDKNSKT